MIGTVGERMLRLTAQYADAWNAYFSMIGNSPERFAELQENVDAACHAVGRDPSTLARTVGVLVDVRGDRGQGAGPWTVPALTGSPREIADGLRAFERAGASEIQVWIEPTTLEGIEGFAPVIEELRAG
jgi:alkanesulfonate monooxygenase SsuD/methylene tetrahydromethanopterin reductase-like flavin-dependent oxidoreductase (luciferase family)